MEVEKLKTLKDIGDDPKFKDICFKCEGFRDSVTSDFEKEIKKEAINIFKNLQTPYTIYPIILESLPESQRGSFAYDKWNDNIFRYGAEYGMLAMLFWFMNITEENLE